MGGSSAGPCAQLAGWDTTETHEEGEGGGSRLTGTHLQPPETTTMVYALRIYAIVTVPLKYPDSGSSPTFDTDPGK